MTRLIPVARQLPHIANHVEEAVAVRREAAYRRGARIAVLFGVVDWKDALPRIGNGLAVLVVGLAPILTVIFAAARGIFPLRFGWKFTAEPVCIRERIFVGDMHHGIILFALDRRARPFWLVPIRTFHVLPPLREIAAPDQCGRLDEKHGPWHKQVLGHPA